MTKLIAQIDFTSLGNNPKTWAIAIAGLLASMILGRFVQAFRNGAGIKGAAAAVWLGTNTSKDPTPPADKTNP